MTVDIAAIPKLVLSEHGILAFHLVTMGGTQKLNASAEPV